MPTTQTLILVSCGCKHEPPPENDLLIDCLHIPNPPFSDPDGRSFKVQSIVAKHLNNGYNWWWQRTVNQVLQVLATKQNPTVCFQCYGGRHRSVATAEMIGKAIQQLKSDCTIHVRHRDVERRSHVTRW